jgi:exopolysaccharide production protein ExoQ
MNAHATTARWTNLELAEPSGLNFAVGFFFAIRTAVVFFCVRLFGLDPSTGSAANLGLGFLLLLLVCFQSFGHVHRSFGSMLRLPPIAWAFAFLLFSLCSLAWSATVSLPNSFAYWCGLAFDVALVVLLFRAGSTPVVAHSILKGFIAGACCLALLAWILPADPSDLRLGDAEFFNTNQIGNLCAFAILLAQYLMRRKDGRWKLAAVFLAITLIRSLSKTTIFAFLVCEVFLFLRDRSITRKTRLLLLAATLVVAGLFWGLFQAYFDIYTTSGNQAETLTGRTAIWATVLDAALQHPILGHGFDSLWKIIPPFGPDRFEARHAENELLQQFYAYGVFGVVLLAGLYASLFLQIRRLPRSPVKIAFFSILLYVLVRGLAEAEPFDLLLPLWSIVLLSLLIEDEKNARIALPESAPNAPDQEPHAPAAQTPPSESPREA